MGIIMIKSNAESDNVSSAVPDQTEKVNIL